MTFLGHFKAPAVGTTVVPINIGGEGKCTVTKDGLEVEGFRTRPRGPFILLVLGALATGAYFLRIRFDLPDWFFYVVLTAGLGLFLRSMITGSKTKSLGTPIKLSIPPSSIKRFAIDPNSDNVVLVVIEDFDPKGGLYFSPHDGAQSFLDALEVATSS